MVGVLKKARMKEGKPEDENYKSSERVLGTAPQSILSSSCD